MSFRQPIIHISEWLPPPGVAALSTKVVLHWLCLPTGQVSQRTTWVILTGAYYQVKAMQSCAITAAPQSGNQEKWLQSEKMATSMRRPVAARDIFTKLKL